MAKFKNVKVEGELLEEMETVARHLGFSKLPELIRVWWRNPIEIGQLIEKAKKELAGELEETRKKAELEKQAEETFKEDLDDVEPFDVEEK